MKQKNMVLMVVAVGCGLVAAFLTSQMSGRSSQVEQVEVIVAAKDIPVGTQLTKEDLPKAIKRKKMPKDGLPPMFVMDENELIEKRLTRPVRAEELFNPADLIKGGVVTLPAGMDMHTLPLGAHAAVAGFVGPGSKVDVLVTVRLGNQLTAMPLLVDMLVLAVDQATHYNKDGTFPQLNSVSFAVVRKQALVIELARARGCTVSLLLRNPDSKKTDDKYNIDEIIKLLSDDQNKSLAHDPKSTSIDSDVVAKRPVDPRSEVPAGPVAEKPLFVKVPIAKEDIAAGTDLTSDLIKDKFELIEITPKQAESAFKDLQPLLGKVFRTGLGKGQWVTESLVGVPVPKPADQDTFQIPKPGVPEPATTAAAPKSEVKPAPRAARKHHDTTITTANGSRTYRYEEVSPGKWKLLGEVRPGDAGESPSTPSKVD